MQPHSESDVSTDMRPGRGVIPPGTAGLIIIAACAIPAVFDFAKPYAKKVAKGFVDLGDSIRKFAEEPEAPPSKTEQKKEPTGEKFAKAAPKKTAAGNTTQKPAKPVETASKPKPSSSKKPK